MFRCLPQLSGLTLDFLLQDIRRTKATHYVLECFRIVSFSQHKELQRSKLLGDEELTFELP